MVSPARPAPQRPELGGKVRAGMRLQGFPVTRGGGGRIAGRGRAPAGVAFGVLAAGLLLARPALALPSPFIFVFVADLLVQLAVLAVLVLPFGWDALRDRLHRLLPTARARLGAGLVLVTAAGLAATLGRPLPDRPPMERAVVEATTDCRPIDPQLAAQLGLAPGAVLVDPRPATSFQAYHLRGSCNRSLARLRTDPLALPELPAGTRVLFLEDRELAPRTVFGGSPPAHFAHLSFGSVPGGVRAYYSRGSRGAWGDAPELVVTSEGTPHQQFGPVWMKGRYATVMGLDRGWRHLGESAVPQARALGRVVLDVRELRPATGAPRLEPWSATLDEAERVAGRPLDGALIVCDGSTDCLAGEGLAWHLRARGSPVLGYVRSEAAVSELLSRPFLSPTASRAASTGLLAALAVLAALAAMAIERLSRHRRRPELVALAPLAALGLVYAAAMAARAFTAEPGELTAATLRLVDLRRFGFDWTLAGLPLLFAAFCLLVERGLPRRRGLVRAGTAFALLFLTVSRGAEAPRDVFLYDLLLLGAALLSQVAFVTVAAGAERRRARAGSGVRVVSLEAAGELAEAGGKIAGLARAERAGHPVLPAAVVLLPAGLEAPALAGAAAQVAERLGAGPYVVRSSAPDEDRTVATPGRYLSVVGVDSPGISEAIARVAASYGLEAGRSIAVLVQPLLRGDWAGVALREPLARGGGILVEASRQLNVQVTAGEGAERRDRLGRHSRRWVGGALDGVVPARAFLRLFARLEAQLGGDLDLEWTWAGRRLWVLQARRAPAEAEARPTGAAAALSALGPGLRWLRGRPNRVVLDAGDFAEFPAATSRATAELLVDLWSDAGPFGAAVRRLFPGARGAFPRPAVVRVGHRPYASRVPPGPSTVLAGPLLRVHRMLLPLRRRRLVQALDARLRPLEARLPSLPAGGLDPAAAAGEALSRRQVLLGEPARVAVAAALLQGLEGRPGTDPDPLLALVAQGELRRVAAAGLGWRGLPDLALERPRVGELAGTITVPESLQSPALPDDPGEAIAQLRGRARQVLAAHAAGLRAALLQVGGDAPFAWSVEALGQLAAHEPVTAPTPIVEDEASAPATLTLAALEAWAGEGRVPPPPGVESRAGIWVGRPEDAEATVAGPDGLVVLGLPTAHEIGELPAGSLVLAAGGTALCHAALVARQRGLRALFGAGDAVRGLQPGERIRLKRDGRWERTGGGGGSGKSE